MNKIILVLMCICFLAVFECFGMDKKKSEISVMKVTQLVVITPDALERFKVVFPDKRALRKVLDVMMKKLLNDADKLKEIGIHKTPLELAEGRRKQAADKGYNVYVILHDLIIEQLRKSSK